MGNFIAENWALPSHPWRGTQPAEGVCVSRFPPKRWQRTLLPWAKGSWFNSPCGSGYQHRCPKMVCPCSGTQPVRGGVVPSPPGRQTATRHSSRLSSSQAPALPADLCLLSAVSPSVMAIPLAAQPMAWSAPLMIACSLISNLNSPCCILMPLLLLH